VKVRCSIPRRSKSLNMIRVPYYYCYYLSLVGFMLKLSLGG
jgi:hypothetical protein